jgi:hypothetical protein
MPNRLVILLEPYQAASSSTSLVSQLRGANLMNDSIWKREEFKFNLNQIFFMSYSIIIFKNCLEKTQRQF